MDHITYRRATTEDAAGISALILESQRQFCFYEFSEEGQRLMSELCGTKAIRHYISRGDVCFVAVCNGVAAAWHRRSISHRLWEMGRQECFCRGNKGYFNLRSSTYAIPVYEKWGFRRTGAADMDHGITSTPMELQVSTGMDQEIPSDA
ncbi:MAG TPA: GNAT family N-acetyltransferase [Pseudomonadales bacterium]